MNRIELIFKVLGLIVCVGFMLLPADNSTLQFTLFGTILLGIGIPHGAIDHLISNPSIDKPGLLRFLLIYISLIAGYLVLWYIFPLFSLFAFLLMSSYHFGQSHFLNIQSPKSNHWFLYISRGGFFLFAILLGDWEATKLILSALVDLNYLNQSRAAILVVLLVSTLFSQEISGPKITKNTILELVILGPILYMSPLLIGFIVYFGFWHALPSMLEEYRYLRKFESYSSIKKFSLHLMPFSLISFAGIGLILFLGMKFLDSNELILVFFVLISLISFPHILYMDHFLKSKNQN
ncbi:Brp/Blh family beta-carotene 15,15'-dioxygenase [Algoriphagus litoralis]|uniref:Brp/Blh family beta-carotene 15,15'-dioxygenase n=1 Tax=Algoriphagus litoralis TaxID=2202829 RepID=UPI000DB984C3|nr:Brp/Blh family beta-carotene 15,15'-dioxygenase [Algoriphagus litoralis]